MLAMVLLEPRGNRELSTCKGIVANSGSTSALSSTTAPIAQRVWFDAGELELLAERLSLDGELSPAGRYGVARRKGVREAQALSHMREEDEECTLGEDPKVLLDVCPRQDGIWFDSGEVTQVLASSRAKGRRWGSRGG